MAGNPVLGFLSVQPTGDGPHATVTKMLRLLGIVVLVGFAFSVLNSVLLLAMGDAYFDGAAAGLMAAGAVGALVIALVITALVLWWITFTIAAWNNHEPRGSTHALILAILATVFGALGVLGVFGLFSAGPLYLVVNLLNVLVAAAELYCGIMILMNRSKATAGTGNPRMGATN